MLIIQRYTVKPQVENIPNLKKYCVPFPPSQQHLQSTVINLELAGKQSKGTVALLIIKEQRKTPKQYIHVKNVMNIYICLRKHVKTVC